VTRGPDGPVQRPAAVMEGARRQAYRNFLDHVSDCAHCRTGDGHCPYGAELHTAWRSHQQEA
jgi:hypothetical protein